MVAWFGLAAVNVQTAEQLGLVTPYRMTSGKSLLGTPPKDFLLEMLQAGGLIPLLQTGSSFFSLDRNFKK